MSLIFVLLTSVSTDAKNTIPAEIKALASKYSIPLDNLSIIVQPVGSDIRLINLNANVFRNPASITKLFSKADQVAKANGIANAMTNNKAIGLRHSG